MINQNSFNKKKIKTISIAHSSIRYEYVEIDGECYCFAEDVFKCLKLENADILCFEEALIDACSIAANIFEIHISTINYIELSNNKNIKMISITGIAMIVLFIIKIAQQKIMYSKTSLDEIKSFEELCQSIDNNFYSYIRTNQGELISSSKLDAISCVALNKKPEYMSFLMKNNDIKYSFVKAFVKVLLPFCISFNSNQKKSFLGKLFGSKD